MKFSKNNTLYLEKPSDTGVHNGDRSLGAVCKSRNRCFWLLWLPRSMLLGIRLYIGMAVRGPRLCGWY